MFTCISRSYPSTFTCIIGSYPSMFTCTFRSYPSTFTCTFGSYPSTFTCTFGSYPPTFTCTFGSYPSTFTCTFGSYPSMFTCIFGSYHIMESAFLCKNGLNEQEQRSNPCLHNYFSCIENDAGQHFLLVVQNEYVFFLGKTPTFEHFCCNWPMLACLQIGLHIHAQKRAHTHTHTHTHICTQTHTHMHVRTHTHTHKQLKQLAELLMSNDKVANIKWCTPPTTFLSCPGKINVDDKLTQITDKVKSLMLLDSTSRMSLLLRYSSGHEKRFRCILNDMATAPHPKTTAVDSAFGGEIANRKDYLQDIKYLRSQGTGQRLQGFRFKPGSGSNPPPPPPPPPPRPLFSLRVLDRVSSALDEMAYQGPILHSLQCLQKATTAWWWTECLVLWMKRRIKVPYSTGSNVQRRVLGCGLSV